MDKNQDPKIIKFSDIKEELVAALESKMKEGKLKLLDKNVNIVDGFVSQPISMEISNSFTLGGPTIPMIMLVGESGQIYFFALRAILPKTFE